MKIRIGTSSERSALPSRSGGELGGDPEEFTSERGGFRKILNKNDPVIELRDVVLRYEGRAVLNGLSLQVPSAQVLTLLGPSGSGKTSLLRILMGLIAPDHGEVLLRGQVVSEAGNVIVPPAERNLAVVFQDLALWPHLTVEGNLAFGLRAHGVSRADTQRRIADMLREVELSGMAQRKPHELSGGEQQRVAIARALVLEPDIVLLDEPLSNLDVGLQQDLLQLFASLFREHRAAAVYITHDPWEAKALGEHVAVLDQGRIVSKGTLDELDPQHESLFVRRLCRRMAR